MDPLVPGDLVDVQAHGAPPGAVVVFVGGHLGAPHCPGFLTGGCVNMSGPFELGRVPADAAGDATLSVLLNPAIAEGKWFVLQALEPVAAGYASDVVVRRTDPEPIPTDDYEDPFEPNTEAPARIVPGLLGAMTIDTVDDAWADWYEIAAPPNRTVRWRVQFVQSGGWNVVAGGPDGAAGTTSTLAAGTQYEAVETSTLGGDHHLLLGDDGYSVGKSVYYVHASIELGPTVDWRPDADGDGAGDAASPAVNAVDPPDPTWVANADDCDDADPALHPGAPEICGDGVAQGCVADRPCDLPAAGTASSSDVGSAVTGAGDFGLWKLAGGDLDADGVAELLVGDYASLTVFEGPILEDETADAAIATVSGRADDAFGTTGVVLPDANGDGIGDLLVGGSGVDAGAANTGGAAVLFGPLTGDLDVCAAPVRLTGRYEENAGTHVADAGDVHGDGLSGVLVDAGVTAQTSAVYLVSAPLPALLHLDVAASLVVESTDRQLELAALAGHGDTNGDGLPEFLVGVTGGAALFDSAATGTIDTAAADAVLLPPSACCVATFTGDVDGDGLDDVALAGTPGSADTAYVFDGPVAGTVTVPTATLVSSDTAVTDGEDVRGPGDTDGDGFADVVVASRGFSGGSPGTVWVVDGPVLGAVPVEQRGVTTPGGFEDHQWSAAIGDATGDGWPDLAVTRDASLFPVWGAVAQHAVTVISAR